MELLESENLNFQSEFACELSGAAKDSWWQFKSKFATDLDSFHNPLVIVDNGHRLGAAETVFNESDNRDYSYLPEDHQSEKVNY